MSTSSFVAWRGPSQLDGSPIMAVIVPDSTNSKTGRMWQIYILRDDMHPVEALHSGADSAICGDCPLRGELGKGRACYVQIGKGPSSTWKASRSKPTLSHAEVLDRLRGQRVRFGAYGDSAALPAEVVSSWMSVVRKRTNYTHAWRSLLPEWKRMAMASVETLEGAQEAWAWGWRTYRITDEPVEGKEIVCPNYTRGVQCYDCGLCDGAREGDVKSITIPAHGNGRKNIR